MQDKQSGQQELFSTIVLVGYLFGINPDRQLCREIHFNLAYRWFC